MQGLGGAVRAASIYAAIGADLTGLSGGLMQARGMLGQFQGWLGGVGSTLMSLGKSWTLGISTPLALIGGKMISTAGDFEAATNILGVAARNSGTDLDTLKSAALAVGGDVNLFGIDAMQAADAMTNFYKAGLNTTEIMGDLQGYLAGNVELTGALRAAIDLAAASDMSLAQTSDLVSIAMATYGLSAEEATNISDSFVGAADASIAEVSDLADAISAFGPTAAQFGWSLDQTLTALALLSERGIKGSEAGTALRSMMNTMTAPTKAVTEAMSALGVSLYDDSGMMKDLPVIIGEMSNALKLGAERTRTMNSLTSEEQTELDKLTRQKAEAQQKLTEYAEGLRGTTQSEKSRAASVAKLQEQIGILDARMAPLIAKSTEYISVTSQLTEEQRNYYIKTLGSAYGMKALTVLLDEGADGWQDMADAQVDAASAQEVATSRTAGFKGALEKLQGSVQTFLITAGTPIIENFATPFVNKLTDIIDRMQDLSPETIDLGVKLGAAAIAAGPLALGVGLVIKTLAGIPLAVTVAVGALALLSSAFLINTQKGLEFRAKMSLMALDLRNSGQEGLADAVQTMVDYANAYAGFSRSVIGTPTGEGIATTEPPWWTQMNTWLGNLPFGGGENEPQWSQDMRSFLKWTFAGSELSYNDWLEEQGRQDGIAYTKGVLEAILEGSSEFQSGMEPFVRKIVNEEMENLNNRYSRTGATP